MAFTVKTVKQKCIQTPSTFLTLSQIICYSLEMHIKYDKNSLKLSQNKFILIILTLIEGYYGLQSNKNSDNCKYDNIYTTINTLSNNYQSMLDFVQSVNKVA